MISIHSPRMGRDITATRTNYKIKQFQSTLPAWGETLPQPRRCGGIAISIHSPRMGRDLCGAPTAAASKLFQSTLPAWGETVKAEDKCRQCGISIHSPRMGRDKNMTLSTPTPHDFNPLSPHGERLFSCGL